MDSRFDCATDFSSFLPYGANNLAGRTAKLAQRQLGHLLIDRCCHDSGARIDLARVPAGLNLLLMVMLMRTHYL
jgi:hypothetical protein